MADRDPKTGRFPKGNGAGWGGPAKGASASRIRKGDPDGIQRMSNDRDVKARQDERREKVLRLYEDVVDDPKQPVMARLVAGDKLLDRIEGKAIGRNIQANVSDPSQLSDADLAAIASSGRAAPAEAPDDPPEPGGVVH